MQPSDWIAIGALAVAVVGWLDNRRRISYTEYAFDVEVGTGEAADDKYVLRNTGTRRARRVSIDSDSVRGYETVGMLFSIYLDPGESFSFWLTHSRGQVPDSVRVTFGEYFKRTRVVRFPQPPVTSASI
jgi:hypothetical protein